MARNDKEVRLANISDFQIERREDDEFVTSAINAALYVDTETEVG